MLQIFPRFFSHLDGLVVVASPRLVHGVVLLPKYEGVGVREHLALYGVVVPHIQGLVLRRGEVKDGTVVRSLYYVIITFTWAVTSLSLKIYIYKQGVSGVGDRSFVTPEFVKGTVKSEI